MDHRGGVHRVAVSLGWQKADGFGGEHGVLVQSMTESADYPQDMNLSGGPEHDLQLDLTFNFEPARLFGVSGSGLGENLSRAGRRRRLGPCAGGGRSCRYRVSETGTPNLSTRARPCGGDGSIAKAGIGDGAPLRGHRRDACVTKTNGGDLQLGNLSTETSGGCGKSSELYFGWCI